MSIDIRAIKIMLDTNILGKGPIAFTKSMLYNPILKSTSDFNEYPYFTIDVEFPEAYLNQIPYDKQVAFFFDKSIMERTLSKYTKQIPDKTAELFEDDREKQVKEDNVNKSEEKDKKLQQSDRSNKNIIIMLRILFPTKYPISNNITSSFASVVKKSPEFNIKLTDFIPSFLRKKLFEGMASYSYLKIDGKIYTVSQIIWLNDIYNHKEYGQLVEKFDKLNKWKTKEKDKLIADIDKKHTKFNKTYGEYLGKIKTDELTRLKKMKEYTQKAQDQNKSITELLTREQQNKFSTFDENIDKLVDSLNTLKGILTTSNEPPTKERNDTISTTSQQIATFYDTLIKESTLFTPSNKTLLEKFVSNLNRDIEDILVLEYILDVYLDRPGVNLDFEKDEPRYRDKLKEKYKIYTDFAENIKKFRAPQRESSNPILQKTIDEFLDNTETIKGMFNFIMNPYNLRKDPIKEELKKKNKGSTEANAAIKDKLKKEQASYASRMDTGVTLLTSASENEPFFEIYLQVNLIGGELNDDNKTLVDCMYKGESLGDRLEFLLNESLYYPWTVKSSRIFFDITEGVAKEAITAAEAETKEKTKDKEPQVDKPLESEKKTTLLQGGSYSMTRKVRANFMRSTRRLY